MKKRSFDKEAFKFFLIESLAAIAVFASIVGIIGGFIAMIVFFPIFTGLTLVGMLILAISLPPIVTFCQWSCDKFNEIFPVKEDEDDI